MLVAWICNLVAPLQQQSPLRQARVKIKNVRYTDKLSGITDTQGEKIEKHP
jgi:hypothetical protein